MTNSQNIVNCVKEFLQKNKVSDLKDGLFYALYSYTYNQQYVSNEENITVPAHVYGELYAFLVALEEVIASEEGQVK